MYLTSVKRVTDFELSRKFWFLTVCFALAGVEFLAVGAVCAGIVLKTHRLANQQPAEFPLWKQVVVKP